VLQPLGELSRSLAFQQELLRDRLSSQLKLIGGNESGQQDDKRASVSESKGNSNQNNTSDSSSSSEGIRGVIAKVVRDHVVLKERVSKLQAKFNYLQEVAEQQLSLALFSQPKVNLF
jgi:hypothetical protein